MAGIDARLPSFDNGKSWCAGARWWLEPRVSSNSQARARPGPSLPL